MTVLVSCQQSDRIRPLQETDIPAIAALHDSLAGRAPANPARTTQEHFRRIFLQHPWQDSALPSLVYETAGGGIAGCIGVMPRPMRFGERTLTAAVTHNFFVAPAARSSMAALRLARQVLAGPQQLTLAEGNDMSRCIWERFNGSPSLLYSLHWTRPLYPGRYLLSFLRNRGLASLPALMLEPFAWMTDLAITRLFNDRFSLLPPPDCTGEELDSLAMCNCLTEYSSDRTLYPVPDEPSCAWLLHALEQRCGKSLHRILVRRSNGEIIGWYLYCEEGKGRTGNVVQLDARDDACRELVLNHMFHHARQQGVCSLSGQMDPALFRSLARHYCAFHHDGHSWLLIHSGDPEILNAINAGKALLSRLAGEWWINYINN